MLKISSPRTKPFRIGWIIENQLENSRLYHRINVNIGGISLGRYNWISSKVNATPQFNLKYEIYRPWKRYDGLIFLKSMGERARCLAQKYSRLKRPVIFDANVNYYQIEGKEYYQGMLPSEKQKKDAVEITSNVDGVIADSEFLREICGRYNKKVYWIPDNVRMDLVPPFRPWKPRGDRLPLLWCGESLKLFELLLIEDLLKKYCQQIELILVTNNLSSTNRWYADYKNRFDSLLKTIPHQIVPYQSIDHLFRVYYDGGVIISPRFLDNSYNLGHTEWKISLGMACGRIALCSPVPSYKKVADRSGGKGIRICFTQEDWEKILLSLISGDFDWEEEEIEARRVIEKYYSTDVVAQSHAETVLRIIQEKNESL